MNKTQEREVAAFVEDLKLHLPRLIEEAQRQFRGRVRTREDGELVTELAIADLWKNRFNFDPAQITLTAYFGKLLSKQIDTLWEWDGFTKDHVQYAEEERAVILALRQKEAPEPQREQYTGVKVHLPIAEPEKINKECPPCWRCRWFYGWLPKVKPAPSSHSDPEIAEACNRINENKIRIANMVRSGATWTKEDLKTE